MTPIMAAMQVLLMEYKLRNVYFKASLKWEISQLAKAISIYRYYSAIAEAS